MRRILKTTGWILLVAFLGIQFIRPTRNEHPAHTPLPYDISTRFPVPAPVQQILQTSCYDCHSNHTQYPWYAAVQPVAWWLQNHVEEGKHELNFNEFAQYRPGKQFRKLEEIIDEVKEGEMPLQSYTLVHRSAKLDKEQRVQITQWASALMDTLQKQFPPDSFRRKR